MDPRTAAPMSPDPDAVEFVRFCYRRRRVGWPELYDEMCAVANRGLFRGYGCDDLAARGIGFALFDLPRLAALAGRIVDEEKAARRPMHVIVEVPVERPGHRPVDEAIGPVGPVVAIQPAGPPAPITRAASPEPASTTPEPIPVRRPLAMAVGA